MFCRTFTSFYTFPCRVLSMRWYLVRIRLTPTGSRRRSGEPRGT